MRLPFLSSRIRLPVAALLAVLGSSPTSAAMQVDRSIVYFEAGGPGRSDVTVRNDGTEPLYVETEILEVLAPGTPEETRTTVTLPYGSMWMGR